MNIREKSLGPSKDPSPDNCFQGFGSSATCSELMTGTFEDLNSSPGSDVNYLAITFLVAFLQCE